MADLGNDGFLPYTPTGSDGKPVGPAETDLDASGRTVHGLVVRPVGGPYDVNLVSGAISASLDNADVVKAIASGSNAEFLRPITEGAAYAAEQFIAGAAGRIAHVQLFNPVGSGRRVFVRYVSATRFGSAMNGNIRRFDEPLQTGSLASGFIIEPLGGGGGAAVAQLRTENLLGASGSVFHFLGGPANSPVSYPRQGRDWGHELREGEGILVNMAPAGVTLITSWQWYEVTI